MFSTTRKKSIGLAFLLLAGLLIIVLLAPNIASGAPGIDPSAGALGLVCTIDPDNGVNPTFDMEAIPGYVQTPDGNVLFMWGYTLLGHSYQDPGPILCVNEGDTVTINLTNNLPVPVSMIFPGQVGVTATGGSAGVLTQEAAPSQTVQYSFVAGAPGTFLYESGTNPQVQINMGLYGALVVRPSLGANYAYNDASTEFSDEFILLLHEKDPLLHQHIERGEAFNITQRHDRYWTINGRSMPDTLNDNLIPWMPTQPYGAMVRVEADAPVPVLVRYANAGTVNHPYHPHGDDLRVIAQDGRALGPAGYDGFTRTVAAGQTLDMLFDWDNVEGWQTNGVGPLAPVQVPGIADLVFKDGVTFYSGDAYLGSQGDLPVGVTSYNQCGEFYFPWHSHALDEVQNFDEGFGGMMTLVRVDPPGGCP